MANIICVLAPDQLGRYLSMRETLPEYHGEVYEAVGAEILYLYEQYGRLPVGNDCLVRLGNGFRVEFSYDVCSQVEIEKY